MASVGFGSVSGAIWGNIVLRLGNRAIETDVRRRKPFAEHFGPAGRPVNNVQKQTATVNPAFPGPSENTMSIISSTEIHSGCSDSSNNSEYLGS
jgi:hypothetical protein